MSDDVRTTNTRPKSAPVNPANRGTYLVWALLAFVAVVGAIYYSVGGGADSNQPAPEANEQVEPNGQAASEQANSDASNEPASAGQTAD